MLSKIYDVTHISAGTLAQRRHLYFCFANFVEYTKRSLQASVSTGFRYNVRECAHNVNRVHQTYKAMIRENGHTRSVNLHGKVTYLT